eukprot:CAMPEP_0185857526 /NCGR_PEP_ID=MMETSP1354-20130828/29549_1 /TAXON_ID=708628 /ORGANISM="Erythrolobus madagascarensis, Strain CCMP3276" /LENGTH=75 /DNA_ID=CAMNT_0028559797 /DNA_START=839 /DNA_END=1066 /DNA_ORIENTATION=+
MSMGSAPNEEPPLSPKELKGKAPVPVPLKLPLANIASNKRCASTPLKFWPPPPPEEKEKEVPGGNPLNLAPGGTA